MGAPAPGGINVDSLPGLDDLDFANPTSQPALQAPQ